MHLKEYVRLTRESEQLLADAFALLLDRHGQDAELRQGAELFLGWCGARLEALDAFQKAHGSHDFPEDPGRLRSALYHDPRIGGFGLLRDLHDTALLAQNVRACWTVLGQSVRALHEAHLEAIAARAGEQASRQLLWLEGRMKVTAPQALVVEPKKSRQLLTSRPFHASPAALPDILWAPLVAALLLFAIGALGMTRRAPWLLPSIVPSIYLVALKAPHPTTRPYNIFVGHMLALGAGFLSVAIFDAWDAPDVLATGVMTWDRVFAATVAILLTIAFALALRASHPPAGATTVLVALGSLDTGHDAIDLTVGAALIAVFGGVARYVRMGRLSHRRERRARLGLDRPAHAPHR